jgi:hypothetical protein
MERDPVSETLRFSAINEELLEKKNSGSGLEN